MDVNESTCDHSMFLVMAGCMFGVPITWLNRSVDHLDIFWEGFGYTTQGGKFGSPVHQTSACWGGTLSPGRALRRLGTWSCYNSTRKTARNRQALLGKTSIHYNSSTSRPLDSGVPFQHPNTPWDCHICRSVGVVLGVNVGIYGIHGVSGAYTYLNHTPIQCVEHMICTIAI